MLLNRENLISEGSSSYHFLAKGVTLLVILAGLTALAACGSDASSADAGAEANESAETAAVDGEADDASETIEADAPPADVTVAEFDDRIKPVVPFSGAAINELGTEDVIVGDGAEAIVGSFVDVHYVGVLNSNGEQFDASWDRGAPFSFGLGSGQVIAGWDEGVVGMREGGRRILRIPSAMAYGDSDGGAIPAGSDLVFTVDLAAVIEPADPADEPQLTAPAELSGELEVEDIAEGSGRAAEAGDTVKIHFAAIIASTGETFVSSWQQGGLPADFVAGTESGLAGFDQGLIGVKEGGTRKITIPPDLAFGAAGIPGQVEPDETIIIQFDVVSITPGNG